MVKRGPAMLGNPCTIRCTCIKWEYYLDPQSHAMKTDLILIQSQFLKLQRHFVWACWPFDILLAELK
jgi:hypothetical protein